MQAAKGKKRILALKAEFMSGNFGASLFARPQVVHGGMDADGLALIDDGLSTVSALLEIKHDVAKGVISDDAVPCNVKAILENGLEMDLMEYTDPLDRSQRIRWQAMRHDQDSSRCRFTTLSQIRAVCEGFFKEAGEQLDETRKAMVFLRCNLRFCLEVDVSSLTHALLCLQGIASMGLALDTGAIMRQYYGSGKSRTIGRWLISLTLPAEARFLGFLRQPRT